MENDIIEYSKVLNFKKSIAILSADEVQILKIVNELCVKNKTPLINVGYFNDVSSVGPFYIPEIINSACLMCNSDKVINSEKISDSLIDKINSYCNMAPSWFGNNAISSICAIYEIINYIQGDIKKIKTISKRIGISNSDFINVELPFKKNENCILEH